ncbi:ABC transporter ATP-binding protein [Frigoribacterium sp. 2-23]|uniref:ABC transporter ATP-binding protein n=1 Tax=Frigoribacterium sp. 2-23 TaxID=3415006 RepID=UPI003C6FDBD0
MDEIITNTGTAPHSGADDTTAADAVIRVSGLGFSYGDFDAVSGVDLIVRRGELYALLGTNGAGKTTTLEVLEGHRRPTAGTVEVLGGDPTDRSHTRKRMGIMLQDSGLPGEMTVRESVRLAGAVSGRDDDVDDVLARVGIDSKSGTRVAQLSGGEKRRVDFAMAVWGTPELVFLDEPTTGLDPQARDDLWALVGRLREQGVTFVLTTHYLEEAERYADRVGLMHRGSIRREGTVAELTAGATTTIRFVSPCPLDELPLAAAGTENGLAVIPTDDPQRDASVLLTWASERGFALDRFSTHETGLDDVFRLLGQAS